MTLKKQLVTEKKKILQMTEIRKVKLRNLFDKNKNIHEKPNFINMPFIAVKTSA
jgi:hypothetical protein